MLSIADELCCCPKLHLKLNSFDLLNKSMVPNEKLQCT